MPMKQFFTLLAMVIILVCQATTGNTKQGGAPQKTEIHSKKEQAKLLKAQCPHYPSAQSYTGAGISKTLGETFESWKKNYPEEYASYLKIFNYTR